jgi:predicted nucleotidyltransferase
MGAVPAAVREVVERAVRAVRAAFADRVRSIALFGSQARGEAAAGSDVDLAIVLSGSGADDHGALTTSLRVHDLRGPPFISAVIWSDADLLRHPWLLIDVAVDGIVLLDDGTLVREMDAVRRRLAALGSRRVHLGDGSWYWDLKPDWKPGDVIEI